MIQEDWEFLKFLQIKERERERERSNSAEQVNYLFPPSLLQLKNLRFLFQSLTFNAFCMILQHLSQFFEVFKLKKGGPNFLVRANPAERLNYLTPLLYINFKNWRIEILYYHSLDVYAFYIIQYDFSQISKMS